MKTEDILNEREKLYQEEWRTPESYTGPVLEQDLTDKISRGTIIRTFDSDGNRLVIGLLSKKPPSEKGFIGDESNIESIFSKRMAKIGVIRGTAILMVEDSVLDNCDLKAEVE